MKFDRRTALKVAIALSVLAIVSTGTGAHDGAAADFLFVQNAKAVSLKDGVLTRSGIAAHTLYFSDRPQRIAGRVRTTAFVGQWAKGDDSFMADPPNAVLSLIHDPEPVTLPSNSGVRASTAPT